MTDCKQKDAEHVLALADALLDSAEASLEQRDVLLSQAVFLTRLAAALVLDPNFPALPDGFSRLLDRDRARTAAAQLSLSHRGQGQSHTKRHLPLTPGDRNPGRPAEEIDHRLAAETTETLKDLNTLRRELFQDYLDLLRRDEPSSPNPEVQNASLMLLDCYWRDRKRLPRLGVVQRSTAVPRRCWWRGIVTAMDPPTWKKEVTWELWKSLDHKTLYWSAPLPADDAVAPSLADCRTISVTSQDL